MPDADRKGRVPAVILVGGPEEEDSRQSEIEAAVDRLGRETGEPAGRRGGAGMAAPGDDGVSVGSGTRVPEDGGVLVGSGTAGPGDGIGRADAGAGGAGDSGEAAGGETAGDDGRMRRPRPKRRVGLGRRVGLWIVCYLLVALMYVGFFSYPVEPARLEGLNYVASEKVYQTLPYTYEIDYISVAERSVVVVLTVRTIQVPDRAYSAALRNAEGITEDYLREQYGLNVDVRYSGESKTTVQGHEAVRQDYDVYDTVTGPLGRSETVLVAKMSVLAWFCNENFVSVAAGFFHRAGVSPDITGSLRCH